jgi:hypothetical protein
MKCSTIASFFFFVFLQSASAQVPLVNGTCDHGCYEDNVGTDLSAFLGIWYLQQFTPGVIPADTKCGYWNLSSVIDNNTVLANYHFITVP